MSNQQQPELPEAYQLWGRLLPQCINVLQGNHYRLPALLKWNIKSNNADTVNLTASPAQSSAAASNNSDTANTMVQRQGHLNQLNQEIFKCQRCPLHRGRRQAVPGIGALNPQVMAIGEAPGANEDAQGEPFVGRAGQYLDKWLKAIGISRRSNAYIANIVKCRPPHNRDPQRDEVHSCRPFLDRQIKLIVPRAILILGRIAAQHLFDTNESLASLRLRDHRYRNIPVFITYHPSAVLRNPQLRQPVWGDLQRLQLFLSNSE